MPDTRTHYESHLADYYVWMSGGFEKKLDDNRRFFRRHLRPVSGTPLAVDLGAGCGFQSIPLAEWGYRVLAIDFSAKLLHELAARAGSWPITTIEGDLRDAGFFEGQTPELVVCMGDTLTHIIREDEIRTLFKTVWHHLRPGGQFILTYRDLTQELTGHDRFFPVGSSNDRLFTCFLEYHRDTVRVFDIVWERTDAVWKQKVSSYDKRRLAASTCHSWLEQTGFSVTLDEVENGFTTIIAGK